MAIIPPLTTEDRRAALNKAKKARAERAELRKKLNSGEVTLAEVLAMKQDPVIGRMRVSMLIETMPGYGKIKSKKIMSELNIAESRRLRGLGKHQEQALLERLT